MQETEFSNTLIFVHVYERLDMHGSFQVAFARSGMSSICALTITSPGSNFRNIEHLRVVYQLPRLESASNGPFALMNMQETDVSKTLTFVHVYERLDVHGFSSSAYWPHSFDPGCPPYARYRSQTQEATSATLSTSA